MAGNLQDGDEEITGINVTPLVDVMLVLLVIFMVTASYIVHKSINVQLPQAETGENQTKTKNLAFVLDSGQKLYLDGKEINFSEIGIHIARTKANLSNSQKNLQALITADEKTPHGSVVKLIDTVRKNGITEFAINVDSGSTETDSTESKPSKDTDTHPSP